MEKIIDVTALTDALKILLWDRSKSREEMIELAVALIEKAGEEIVRCKDCERRFTEKCALCFPSEDGEMLVGSLGDTFFCKWMRRDSDG